MLVEPEQYRSVFVVCLPYFHSIADDGGAVFPYCNSVPHRSEGGVWVCVLQIGEGGAN